MCWSCPHEKFSPTGWGTYFMEPSAKWKCGTPSSKIMKSFKTVTAEHQTKHMVLGPCAYRLPCPRELGACVEILECWALCRAPRSGCAEGRGEAKRRDLGLHEGMNACGHWVETVVPQQGTDVKQQWIQNVCRQLDGPGFGRAFATKQRYLTLFL